MPAAARWLAHSACSPSIRWTWSRSCTSTRPSSRRAQRFLLSHSFAKIRLLTQRPVPYTSPHKLAAIGRRLSGHMEIRTVSSQFAARTSGILIGDNRTIVYRAQVTSFEGVAGFEQPPIARLYLQEFDEMWLASVPKY